MRTRLAVAALALAAVSSIGSAQAAADANPWSFGVAVGGAIPMGDFGNAVSIGFGGGVGASYRLAPEWSLRGELTYNTWSFKSGLGASGSVSSIGGMVSAVFDIPMEGGFKPYALGGLGMYNGSCNGCVSETKVGFGGGVGGGWMMGGQRWFAEVRYITIQTTGGSTNYVPIMVGIVF